MFSHVTADNNDSEKLVTRLKRNLPNEKKKKKKIQCVEVNQNDLFT